MSRRGDYRSARSRFGRRLPWMVLVATIGAASSVGGQSVVPTSAALLADAQSAQRAGQLDTAIEQLYRLAREHPGTREAVRGRLQLAQLLALSGHLDAALLQCQRARDETSPSDLERQAAIDISTTLVRELRVQTGRRSYFPSISATTLGGIRRFVEPTTLLVIEDGTLVVADRGEKRIYSVTGAAVTTLASTNDPTAATALSDGTLAIADRQGLLLGQNRSTLVGTWGGSSRELRNVRALASNSRGVLFVVDGDYDGVLRCPSGASSCEPFGVPGEARTVKVDPSDYVYVLDDGDPLVRVFDPDGRPIATVGPQLGSRRLREIRDIAVDRAFGVYLLDDDSRTVEVARLRRMEDGRLRAAPIASIPIPREGPRALDRPSTLGVTPDGSVLVTGRSTSTLLKLQ